MCTGQLRLDRSIFLGHGCASAGPVELISGREEGGLAVRAGEVQG